MHTTIIRNLTYFIAAVAMSVLSGVASAIDDAAFSSIYKTTTPYAKEDKTKVLVFFSYECKYCRKYHPAIAGWGKNLPKPYQLHFILTSNGELSNGTINAALAHWTMERIGSPEQKSLFADSAYALWQDNGMSEDIRAWISIIQKSGVNPRAAKKAFEDEQKVLDTRFNRQIHYLPTETPTMVICGKYVISPNSTKGNQETFFQLANGLLSKCIQEQK